MLLELGCRVDCTDGSFGTLAEIVVEPATNRVTHLVVDPDQEDWLARLVPVERAEAGAGEPRTIKLAGTVADVRDYPAAREAAYLRLGEFPVEEGEWDVGDQSVVAVPLYNPPNDLEATPLEFAVAIDRVPSGEVSLRRTSPVETSDGYRVGEVGGVALDAKHRIGHLVVALRRTPRTGPRRQHVAVPVSALVGVMPDKATLLWTKDEAADLPDLPSP